MEKTTEETTKERRRDLLKFFIRIRVYKTVICGSYSTGKLIRCPMYMSCKSLTKVDCIRKINRYLILHYTEEDIFEYLL